MADNTPTTSVNSELISAGLNPNDPSNSYTDFANQMVKARQEQAAQEQAIARAKELTAQAGLQTAQETAANEAGINPSMKGYMTKGHAIAQARLILEQKGTPVNDDVFSAWADKLPEMVPTEEVETFANRFSTERAHMGKEFQATEADAKSGKTDENGDPLVPGQMYSTLYDNSMKNLGYIRSGKEPVDQSAKLSLKAGEDTEKQWQKLNDRLDNAFKTSRSSLGVLSTAIFRSVRAINTLTANPNLTAQDLANVSQDVAGIFQGGSPTVLGSKENDYRTIFTDFENFFRKYTGVIGVFSHLFGNHDPLTPTKEKLIQVCVDLRDTSVNSLRIYMESEMPAFKTIIEADRSRWQEMIQAKQKILESGLLTLVPPEANTKLNITGMGNAAMVKDPHGPAHDKESAAPSADVDALAKALGLKKKSTGK